MQFYAISDNRDVLVGLRLAGILGDFAKTAEEVKKLLNSAKENEKIAVILITNTLAKLCSEDLIEFKTTIEKPILVEIPNPKNIDEEQNSLAEFVKKAVGISI